MQNQKHIRRRAAAWLLALTMAVMPAASLPAWADDEDDARAQIAELNDQYKELQAQQKQLQAKIDRTKSEKDKQLAIKQQIDSQIDTTKAQINVLEERIDVLEGRISKKEDEMDEKQAEIDETYALFKQRMRAMCAVRQTTTLGLALGADDFSQMLTRTAVVTRVAEHDDALIEKLNEEKDELRRIKESIELDRRDVEGDKEEMSSKKAELDGQMAETQSQIQDIALQEQQFLANKEEMLRREKQVQAEMDKIYAMLNPVSSSIPYVGGSMGWPAPSISQVTSGYGYRWGGDFHTGIDISGGGAYGSPVVAANTGTVVVANTSYSQGVGYGKYVIVDHGGGITTLYGHCSEILVSVGQTVSRGEKIALVGSTGNSTGPHCHFEVRVNGKHQNPVGYLNG